MTDAVPLTPTPISSRRTLSRKTGKSGKIAKPFVKEQQATSKPQKTIPSIFTIWSPRAFGLPRELDRLRNTIGNRLVPRYGSDGSLGIKGVSFYWWY